MRTAEGEARRALARLRRSVEKARRELDALRGAIVRAEGSDFPDDDYAECDEHLAAVADWTSQEEARLRAKVLCAGGLEPGRVRRSTGM